MDKVHLLKVEGYFFGDDDCCKFEDIQKLESKLIDFLEKNGYYFVGTSDIVEDDEE